MTETWILYLWLVCFDNQDSYFCAQRNPECCCLGNAFAHFLDTSHYHTCAEAVVFWFVHTILVTKQSQFGLSVKAQKQLSAWPLELNIQSASWSQRPKTLHLFVTTFCVVKLTNLFLSSPQNSSSHLLFCESFWIFVGVYILCWVHCFVRRLYTESFGKMETHIPTYKFEELVLDLSSRKNRNSHTGLKSKRVLACSCGMGKSPQCAGRGHVVYVSKCESDIS